MVCTSSTKTSARWGLVFSFSLFIKSLPKLLYFRIV